MSVQQILISLAAAGGGSEVVDTWDSARLGADAVLSNSDLTITLPAGGGSFGQTNCGVATKSTTGLKVYLEILVGTQGSNAGRVGLVTGTQTAGGSVENPYCNIDMAGTVRSSIGTNNSGAAGYSSGDVIGIAIDRTDANDCLVNFYKNGAANGDADFGNGWSAISTVSIYCADHGFTQHVWTMRTTAAEFSYSPPSGFGSWGSAT